MITLTEDREPFPPGKKAVVVDTTVIVDAALDTAARHTDALSLLQSLTKQNVRIVVPFHAAFEFLSTVRRIIRFERGRQAAHTVFTSTTPGVGDIELHAVPIDAAFVNQYPTNGLPQLKAGDLLFLAVARAGGVPLITDDTDLLKKARDVGHLAFTVSEYLKLI